MIEKRRTKNEKKNFIYWFSRFASLGFVLLMYGLIEHDFLRTLENYPVLFNFLIASIVLALTISFWEKRSLYSGLIFLAVGVIYYIFLLHRLLIVTVMTTSFLLFLIGFMYFFDYLNLYQQKRRRIRRARKRLAKEGKSGLLREKIPSALRPVGAYYKEVKIKKGKA